MLKNWQILFPSSPSPHRRTLVLALSKHQGLGRSCSPSTELLRQCQAGGGFRNSKLTQFLRHEELSAARGGETAAFPTPAPLLCSRNSNSLLISQAETSVSGENPLLGAAVPARCAHLLPQTSPYSEMHYMAFLLQNKSFPLTSSSSTSSTNPLCHKRAFGAGLISKLSSPHCFPRLWDPWREHLGFD